MDCFKIGKGVSPGCILSPFLFNLYAEYIMWNAGWLKHKLTSKFPGEISIHQIYRSHHPYGRQWRETKESLEKGERGELKTWLKTQFSEN